MVKNYFFYLFLLPITVFSQIKITEVYYDTPYNERLSLTNNVTGADEDAKRHHWGEFIELYNYTDKDLSLKNWYIQDYVGTYWLPEKLIKAGGFVVIAYSQPNYDTTPFTELFSTTAGKEDQIIRQNQILLRNKAEGLKLGYYAFDGKIPLPIADAVSVGTGTEPSSNRVKKAWQFPGICYTYPSIQLVSANSYASATPNPLDATYKPPTQNYETLMFDTYQKYYAYLDWSENVTNLTENTCPISILKTEQLPGGSYNNGGKCFAYDTAGNNITSSDCSSPPNNPPQGNEYNTDELETIKNSIVIYPNPATSNNQYNVTISWSGPAINKINNLQIFTSNGGLVYGFSPTSGTNNTVFSLQNQLPGIFIANFILNTGQIISKNILKW